MRVLVHVLELLLSFPWRLRRQGDDEVSFCSSSRFTLFSTLGYLTTTNTSDLMRANRDASCRTILVCCYGRAVLAQ
jgi:hypothetical protein